MAFRMLLALTIASMGVSAYDSYSGSCTPGYLEGDQNQVLYATCYDEVGNTVYATLDLNYCFANYGGNLQLVRNGDFTSSCDTLGTDGGTIFEATCDGPQGSRVHNRLDLNNYIGNCNGNLCC